MQSTLVEITAPTSVARLLAPLDAWAESSPRFMVMTIPRTICLRS